MKIVFFGSSSFGIPCLNALEASEHELAQLFTQPARPTGRGKKIKQTDVAVWAQEHNKPVTEAANINTPDMVAQIKTCNADLLVVIAFGQKISQEVIDLFPQGAINVHGSLLPKYRGAAPVNWAIINGETETGITIITLAQRMDAGQMLAKASTPVFPDDSAGSLHDRLAEISAPVLIETVKQIELGTAVYETQNEAEITFASKLKKSDGTIDWSQPAQAIHNKIRGMFPWPGAHSAIYSNKTKKTYPVTITQSNVVQSDSSQSLPIGSLDSKLHVLCGEDTIEITKLKPAGKSEMDFKSFVNGRGLAAGDRFLSINEMETL